MNQKSKIQLMTSSIRSVPIHIYNKDFAFIVNGEKFETNHIISDLLSPKICQIHLNDPTYDAITIETKNYGHFSYFLNLTNFLVNDIPDNEISFISEVAEILGNESIEFYETGNDNEITIDNVINLIKKNVNQNKFYMHRYEEEIEFIASHFSEIIENQEDELIHLKKETIQEILANVHFQLKDEDELLRFVNQLYLDDKTNFIFYEYVQFSNVSSELIKDFIQIFDFNDITSSIWEQLTARLKQNVDCIQNEENSRYKKIQKKGKVFTNSIKNQFLGIINYLFQTTNGQIENELSVTSSGNQSSYLDPQNVVLYENKNKYFISGNSPNSWICFHFKNHRIIPKSYTIRTYCYKAGGCHPRSWIIEVSNDNSSWEVVDEQINCSDLNGYSFSYNFKISKNITKDYEYIRMRLTDLNFYRDFRLEIEAFEIYGTLI